MTWLPWRHVQTSNFVRVGTHPSNDSYYERKHTTPCRGLDFLAASHKSCPRLPLTLPVIAMFGIEVVGTVIFVYFPRRAEMPTFGNLKSGDSLFCTTRPPPHFGCQRTPPPTNCSSSHGPLYQNEVKFSAFDMEMIFHFHTNKTHFHKKGCALGVIFFDRGTA